MHSNDTQELRDSLFSRAYDQAMSEYESWETYRKEQWLSFLKYGKDDLMDLSMALLSATRRVKYPVAALDLAAYTLAKFGLDSELAKCPTQGCTYNERTGENDPCQFFDLKIRFGVVARNRLHFTPHLLARCTVFTEGNASDYLHIMLTAGTFPHDIVACTQREMQRIAAGACPYEKEAERLCKHAPDDLRRAKEFFYEEKWPSPELMRQIESEFSILETIAKLREETGRS